MGVCPGGGGHVEASIWLVHNYTSFGSLIYSFFESGANVATTATYQVHVLGDN